MTGSLPPLTLVIGGARSGKSAFAEGLVTASGRARRYIATAEAWDDEMRDRIARHQSDRGAAWTTVEAPLDLAAALAGARSDEAVLVDCATLWLTNHLLAEADLGQQVAELTRALAASPGALYVVSNEVGQGIVPDNALARRFRDEAGWMNQAVAAAADRAVLVAAGLPLVLKG